MDSAFIFAGGLGTRLRPLTYAVPKPLLPIGEKPILEIIINKLKNFGIKKIYISVNYKKELIKSYFGDGKEFGVKIYYVEEKEQLGTAGSIKLVKDIINSTFLVMNGDLYTDINLNEMLKFHKCNKSKFTIAVRDYNVDLQYGVLEKNELNILTSFKEKPVISFLINTGIYICEPELIELFYDKNNIDMPEFWRIIKQHYKDGIFLYKFNDKWIDIGKMDEYIKIQEELNN